MSDDKQDVALGLSAEEFATAQAAASLLVEAIVKGEFGMQIFVDKKTGKHIPVLGKQMEETRGNVAVTSFIPLAIIFTQSPHEVCDPVNTDTTLMPQSLIMEVDEKGELIKTTEVNSHDEIVNRAVEDFLKKNGKEDN